MKRIVWQGDNRLELQEVSDPKPDSLGDHDVLLRVMAVGICRTDLHILDGRFPWVKPPRVLGHEISGVIEAVGPMVSRVQAGERVTCDSVLGCGHCDFCVRGSRQFCRQGQELGFTRDGGCQEWLVLPEENVYPVAESTSMEEAAILDMEVYAALKKAEVRSGDTVLVIGAGPAGLVAIQVTRILGARRVLLSGDSKQRLALGSSLGAHRIIDIRQESLAGIIEEETKKRGADLVMDCAGTAESLNQALDSVMPGGRVALYGIYPDPLREVRITPLVLKDLTVFGSLSDRNYWQEVIHLVETGALNLARLITHTFPLEEAAKAYHLLRDRSAEVIKIVLRVT